MKKASSTEISTKDIKQSDIKKSKNRERKNVFNALQKSFEAYKYIINCLKSQGKHASCPHPYSCAHYILSVRKNIEILY